MTAIYHVITPGDHFSPRTGSAVPTVVHGLASGASQLGDAGRCPQHVVLQGDTYRPRYDSAAAIEYRGAPAPGRIDRYRDAALSRLGGTRRAAARYFAPAAAALADRAPGIVLAHNAPLIPWLLRDSPHRTVLYAHNDLLRSYSRAESARVLGTVSAVVAVSEALAAQLREHLPTALHDRVHVVSNGVDTQLFSPAAEHSDEALRVMFFGRAIPEKGADVLLAAAGLVEREDIEYVIVGSHGFDAAARLSPYERRLRELAARAHGRVRFEPFVPRPELPALLRTADLLVLPSRWQDPCPLTVGEGLASGVPVIAARRGGIPEILGDEGILFDPDRPAELATAIAALAADPLRRVELGAAGRRRAVERDWAWAWRQLAAVLDGLPDAGAADAAPGRSAP
jgi:glycosyltransferase involved in cell wall biosynthesis